MIPDWLTIPPQAEREYDRIERLTGQTIDYREVGAWIRFVRDLATLQPLLEQCAELGRRQPRLSILRSWYRAEWWIVKAEMDRRKAGDLPWHLKPLRPGETSLDERVERIHHAWSVERFLTDVCGSDIRFNKCCCPFPDHQDRTPSFVAYPSGYAKCYGCGFGGDVIDLAQRYWALDRPIDAIRRLETL